MAFLKRSMNHTWRKAVVAGVAALLMLTCAARAEGLNEQKIKAGLLYNFLKYTDWPQVGQKTLNVCLFREDSFEGSLDPIRGRTAQQHQISIVRINSASQVGTCHAVFIPAVAASSVSEILAQARGKGILTVSDIHGFARQGGMIEFAMKDDQRIHILINRAAISAADIRIQSRITRLAESVGQ
jgi:hypothetical protein